MVSELLTKASRYVKEVSKDSYTLRSSTKLVGFTAFIATFTDAFLYGALIPVLPYALVDRFGVAKQDVQFWLSTTLVAFGLVNGLSSPLIGWLCGRSRSTRAPYFTGQGLALLATLMMGFCPYIGIMVLARCLQGVSACAMYIGAIGMIIESVDKASRGAWIGFALTGLSTGLIISPSIGGFIYDNGGYHTIYFITIALIVVASSLRLAVIDTRTLPVAEVKLAAQPTIHQASDQVESKSLYRVAEFDEESEGDEDGLLLGQDQTRVSRFAIMFPTMALILGSTKLRAAIVGGFVHTTIITSFDAILPLMLQRTFNWSSSLAGTTFLAIALPSLLSSAAGAVSDRIGPRRTTLFGFMVTICGISPMVLVRNNTLFDQSLLCGLLLVVGIGLTFVLSPLAADVSVESDKLTTQHPEVFKHGAFAQTFATFNTSIGIAAALGPSLSGFLYSKTGWIFTGLILAALCVLAGWVVFMYTSDLDNERETD